LPAYANRLPRGVAGTGDRMEQPGTGRGQLYCTACAFWGRLNPTLGVCRRHAPCPVEGDAAVAHWSETRADQGCGDGEPGAGRAAMISCGACIYWMRPGAGGLLAPTDFVDQPRAWWQQAGYCARHAPRPGHEPGARRVWLATHASDACGEGVARPA